MKKIQKWLSNYWGVILTAVGGSGAALFLLLFKIKSINGGDSLQEITLHNQLVTKSYSVDYLFHHLVFAPYTIGLIILEHLHLTSVSDIRIIGAFFGLISVLLFFYIIWRWYGSLIAIFRGQSLVSSKYPRWGHEQSICTSFATYDSWRLFTQEKLA
jgi:hypothetical protein